MRLAADLARDPIRLQGNWIPHQLRPATDDGIFLAGDSAGHCLPLTAEGIRTALYFGLACGASCAVSSKAARRERRRCGDTPRSPRVTRSPFDSMLRVQRLFPGWPRACSAGPSAP